MSNNKNTEKKAEIKARDAANAITSKAQLKIEQETVNKVVDQKAKVRTQGSLESTYTKIQLRNGTMKETYGERYGRPDGSGE